MNIACKRFTHPAPTVILGRQSLGMLAAVILGLPLTGLGGDSQANTNLPVVVRKAARDLPPSAALQPAFYFGSRLESVTTTVAPQNPYASDYAGILHASSKAIVGFRLALIAHVYLFVGVGISVPNELLDQWWTQNTSFTAMQLQEGLIMQTEYGLGWDF